MNQIELHIPAATDFLPPDFSFTVRDDLFFFRQSAGMLLEMYFHLLAGKRRACLHLLRFWVADSHKKCRRYHAFHDCGDDSRNSCHNPFYIVGYKSAAERVQGIFQCSMKINGIFLKQVIGRQIGSASKPAINHFIRFIIQFKITPVGMYCGNIGIQGMNYQ